MVSFRSALWLSMPRSRFSSAIGFIYSLLSRDLAGRGCYFQQVPGCAPPLGCFYINVKRFEVALTYTLEVQVTPSSQSLASRSVHQEGSPWGSFRCPSTNMPEAGGVAV